MEAVCTPRAYLNADAGVLIHENSMQCENHFCGKALNGVIPSVCIKLALCFNPREGRCLTGVFYLVNNAGCYSQNTMWVSDSTANMDIYI